MAFKFFNYAYIYILKQMENFKRDRISNIITSYDTSEICTSNEN